LEGSSCGLLKVDQIYLESWRKPQNFYQGSRPYGCD